MTYPPQQPGPYGDPYGQQWSQQPDPYGQQYVGQQAQFGPPPGFGVPPPSPPKRNKTALWVGLSVGVVAIVALLVTGFAAPGFFLSGDDGPDAFAEDLVSVLEKQDDSAAVDMVCESADDRMKQESDGDAVAVDDFKIEIMSVEKNSDTTAAGRFRYTGEIQGQSIDSVKKFEFEKEHGDWCILSVSLG